jgi:uncharacterized protein (DUF58 family)
MGNFILFLLVLFVLAALLRIDFFFTILYLFVGVYLLSRMWSRRMLRHLHIERQLQNRAFLGDRITVTLKLENRSRLPIPWLVLSDVFPVDLSTPPFYREATTLPGHGSHIAHYTLTARKRGYYQIGPLTLQTGDLFRIRQELTSRYRADHLIVYPKIVPISKLGLPTHSPQVVLPTPVPLFQDPNRIIGVRAYHQGDNPRYIHWPATAATGQTLVKQFQPAIARDNAIFLNLYRADYAVRGYPDPVIELAITVAASLAHHMLTFENLPVGLLASGIDPLAGGQQQFKLPPRKGRGQLMQILEVLARVQLVGGDESRFLEEIRQAAVHLSWGTTTIIITGHGSDELSKTLLLLKRSGLRVTLVLVQSVEGRFDPHMDQMQELRIPIYKVRRYKEIETWAPAA